MDVDANDDMDNDFEGMKEGFVVPPPLLPRTVKQFTTSNKVIKVDRSFCMKHRNDIFF